MLNPEEQKNLVIVDTRYPYEFEGGHLANALNVYRLDQLEELFFDIPSKRGDQMTIVFHCEYSSERGLKKETIIIQSS